VGDMNNWRMMRVQMDYTLDNLPGITSGPSMVAMPRPMEETGLFASPNPFVSSVTITYALPGRTDATYRIYDMRGRIVFSCDISAGRHGARSQIRWDGRNPAGAAEASGFYIGKLILSNGKVITHKLLLVK
jgi:hypothetical protein